MEKKILIEQLRQKEELLKKTEMIYNQIQGQVSLLRELIKREDIPVEEKKEENK